MHSPCPHEDSPPSFRPFSMKTHYHFKSLLTIEPLMCSTHDSPSDTYGAVPKPARPTERTAKMTAGEWRAYWSTVGPHRWRLAASNRRLGSKPCCGTFRESRSCLVQAVRGITARSDDCTVTACNGMQRCNREEPYGRGSPGLCAVTAARQ